jgi:hypothetical protein
LGQQIVQDFPPVGSVTGALASGYGQYNPVEVKRDPQGNIDWPGTLGATTGRAIGMVGGLLLGGGEGEPKTPKAPREIASDLTSAINPPRQEYRSMHGAWQQEAGDLLDYSNRTGVPLGGLERTRYMLQGLNQEVRNFYQQNMMSPQVAGTEVGKPPLFQGRTMGEGAGQRTTLGDLDARATQLNAQLRDNYMARLAGKEQTGLANDATLKAELTQVDQALYDGISKQTGYSTDDVRAIRQKMGRTYQLGYQTEAAIFDKMSRTRTGAEGSGMPQSLNQAAFQYLNRRFLGGPMGIADKALNNAWEGAGKTPTLPSTGYPQPAFLGPSNQQAFTNPQAFANPTVPLGTMGRTPPWVGMNTAGVPVPSQPEMFSPAEIQAQVQRNAAIRRTLKR